MNKKNWFPIIISILLIVFIFSFQLNLDKPLFAPDGQNHYEYINTEDCRAGYANGLCLMTHYMNLSPMGLWLLMFGISLLIPISIVVYTKNLWMFPLFFIFTGFFWQSMAMQVFAQIIMSLFFVFFIFEKREKFRWLVLGLLWGLLLFGIELHRTMFVFLIIVTVYEIHSYLNNWLEISYCDLIKEKGKVLVCGFFAKESVGKVTRVSHGIREPLNNNTGTFMQTFVYYVYSFFWENMFIGFMIPGIYQIFKEMDFRKIYYFLFVLIGGLGLWIISGFEIWWVTRIFLWFPLVLFVPFINWLNNQRTDVRLVFYLTGLFYFGFNVWYYMNRLQSMGCA